MHTFYFNKYIDTHSYEVKNNEKGRILFRKRERKKGGQRCCIRLMSTRVKRKVHQYSCKLRTSSVLIDGSYTHGLFHRNVFVSVPLFSVNYFTRKIQILFAQIKNPKRIKSKL